MTGELQSIRKLKILGTGSATGAVFDTVRIMGEGEIKGNVECNKLNVMGTVEVRGNIRAERVKILGTSEIIGSLTSEDVSILGELEISGGCNAESFKVLGACTVAGLLNANTIAIVSYGPSSIKEMGGTRIKIKPSFFVANYKTVTVDAIEGDDIHLEYTKAQIVRGKRVYIGKGCEIGLVEYQERIQKSHRSIVGEMRNV